MEYANNLCFENEALIPLLESHFHKPVFFTNDANAAAWGEFIAGCGKGARSLIMVTLGTGIGGGIIISCMKVVIMRPASSDILLSSVKGCPVTVEGRAALKRMLRPRL